ncbi:MAG: hypothetical protein K8T26_11350 [Lentisphaerae bacterium]|nr:hypothetical protein [Lentisphaerota bacterium]
MSTDIKLVNASLIELKQLEEALLSRLNELTGNGWTEDTLRHREAVGLPTEPDPAWGEEAVATLRRYQEIVKTANKRRLACARQQFARFYAEICSPEGASPEMRRWWLARY